MAAFPSEGTFDYNPGVTQNSDVAAHFAEWLEATKQLPGGAREQIITIDTNGKIAPTRCFNRVDTFGAAPADDLVGIDLTNMPITNGNSHGVLWLRIADSARKVTIKHNAGSTSEIFLADTTDFLMDSTGTRLCLVYTGTQWLEYGRWYGSNKTAFRAFLACKAGATMDEATVGDADSGADDKNFSIITPRRLARYRPQSSGEFTIGAAVKNDWNHSLGNVPSKFWGVLVCKTAQLGWAVDNRVEVDRSDIIVWADATKVGFVCNDDPISIINWTTGASGTLTPANWRIVLFAVK